MGGKSRHRKEHTLVGHLFLNNSVGLMDQRCHFFNCEANHLKVNVFFHSENEKKAAKIFKASSNSHYFSFHTESAACCNKITANKKKVFFD